MNGAMTNARHPFRYGYVTIKPAIRKIMNTTIGLLKNSKNGCLLYVYSALNANNENVNAPATAGLPIYIPRIGIFYLLNIISRIVLWI